MCGAYDCRPCRGDYAVDQYEREIFGEQSQRPWLADSGYTFSNGTWERQFRSRFHTARRDHKDGRVKRGDRYRVSHYREISDDDGTSIIRTYKYVLQPAAEWAT